MQFQLTQAFQGDTGTASHGPLISFAGVGWGYPWPTGQWSSRAKSSLLGTLVVSGPRGLQERLERACRLFVGSIMDRKVFRPWLERASI